MTPSHCKKRSLKRGPPLPQPGSSLGIVDRLGSMEVGLFIALASTRLDYRPIEAGAY